MTKEEVIQKVQEIVDKDKSLKGVSIEIVFKDKELNINSSNKE